MAGRDMSIKVVISAVDQASEKLKAITGSMSGLEMKLRGAQTAADQFNSKWSATMSAARGVGTAMTVAGAGAAALAKSGLEASMEMEGYGAKLEVAMKSTEKAAEMMDWAKKTAAQTPFEMPDVVDATAKLEMYGLSAKQWFPAIGDMAGAMGKDVVQGVEAIADAVSGGGLERLKEFGVTGEQLKKFGWSGDYSAKGIDSLKVALQGLLGERFEGGMEKLMNTSKGALSNFGDAVFQLRAAIGDALAPILKTVTPMLVGMASSASDIAKTPLGEWAIKTGAGFGALAISSGPFLLALPKLLEGAAFLKGALGITGIAGGAVEAGKALGKASDGVKALGTNIFRWIVSPEGQITGAFAGIAIGVGLLVKGAADAHANLKRLNEEIGIATGAAPKGATPQADQRIDLMRQIEDINKKRAQIRGILDQARTFGVKTSVWREIGGEEGVKAYEAHYAELGKQRDELLARRNAIPRRASGGPVRADELYLVGEQGPELFVPETSGRIATMDQAVGSRPMVPATRTDTQQPQEIILRVDLAPGLVARDLQQDPARGVVVQIARATTAKAPAAGKW